jgi:DNA polymerase-1
LQNIPVRRELGGEIRKMFVASPGNVLVDADYSQIELRILAHISDDESMKSAFLSGEDIHRMTASQVLGKAPEDVTSTERSHAKAVNFGIVYGISAFSLSEDIGVSVAVARDYINTYMAKYHGVRDYMERVVNEAKETGCAVTLYGRRRPLPELKSSNFNLRSFGERVARNMPIQGTAADIMKIAMINVSRALEQECPNAKLLLQVHDELIVECPESDAELVKEILKREMESAASLSVPLTVEAHSGKNWHEAK